MGWQDGKVVELKPQKVVPQPKPGAGGADKADRRPVTMADLRAAGIVKAPAEKPPVKKAVPKKLSTGADVAKSVAFSGLPKAATGTFGGLGDAFGLASAAGDWLADKTGVDARPAMREATRNIPVVGDFVRKATGDGNLFATSTDLNDKVQSTFGEYHKPQTWQGRYSEQGAEFVGNALAPGGLGRKALAVAVPAVASQGARDGAAALGLGEGWRTAAEVAGGLTGGTLAATRVPRLGTSEQRAVRQVAGNRRMDIPRVRQQIEEARSFGAEPVFADFVGDGGQGVIRAAATRQTPARQTAVDFAAGRREDMQDYMGQQVDRFVHENPRTPDEITEALSTRRDELADVEYPEPYAQMVRVTPEMASALRGDPGRAALQRARAAAVARRNDQQIAEIDQLMSGDLDGFPEVSAGTVDRIRIAMSERATTAGRRNARDMAGGLRDRAGDIDAALDDVDGLGEARATFRGLSEQIDAVPLGQRVATPKGSRAFAQQVGQLSPDARGVVREGAAGALHDLASTPAGAATLADSLATSRGRQRQMGAILSPEEAQGLRRSSQVGRQQLETARNVSPRTGSETSLNLQDARRAAGEGLQAATNVATGNGLGLIRQGVDWLRSRGLSDEQAQAIVELSLDPNRLEEALSLIEQRLGQQARDRFLAYRLTFPVLAGVQGAQAGQE